MDAAQPRPEPVEPQPEYHDAVISQPTSVLDRAVTFPRLTVGWAVISVALLAALLLRLPGLNRWALSADEGALALAAERLVSGEDVPRNLLGMPFVVEWLAFFMFLADGTITVGRVSMALAGIGVVVLIMLSRRWFGWTPALAAGALAAISPTLIATSRRMDGGALLVLLSLLLLSALLQTWTSPRLLWPGVAGLSASLLLLSGPLGLPALLLTLLGFWLIAKPAASPSRNQLLTLLAVAAAALLLVPSVFFTQPASLPASIGETFRLLWRDHLSELGGRWWMPAFNLFLNEALLVALALVGAFSAHTRRQARPLAIWFLAAFVLVSLLGDIGPAGYGLVVLPLVLTAGHGVAALITMLSLERDRRGIAALYVGVILLLAAAFLSLAGVVSDGADRQGAEQVIQIVLVIGVVVVPLGYGLARFGPRLAGKRLILLLTAGLAVLALLGVRAAVLSASEWPGKPGDPLSAGVSSPNVAIVVDRIERISRDLTFSDRDSLDPAGGHGLRIAIDERIADPFSWYFRQFPNAVVFDPATEPTPLDSQVVILDETRDPDTVTPGLASNQYLLRYGTPSIYASPDWTGLLAGIFRISEWQEFGDFILNRGLDNPAPAHFFQIAAVEPVAERMFASSGPYTLDDRAGAGQAQGQFNQPRGIAVAEDGAIYVVDSGNARVQRFTPDGIFDLTFGSQGSAEGQFGRFQGSTISGPGGIAIGSNGNIYVADTWNHRVQVFTPAGEFVTAWGSFFDAADDPLASQANPGLFYGPRDIAVHDGLVYVTDTGNERVQVFTEEGKFVQMFGSFGSDQGQLVEPFGIDVAEDGTVLVADSHNARIARFTSEGEPLDAWPVPSWQGQTFFEPYLRVGPDGKVYVSTSVLGTVSLFDQDGVELGTLPGASLERPYGIAVLPDSEQLLVSDGRLNAVVRVDTALAAE
jgi:DNA-binding beta-propeller fold protein YncE